MFDHGRAVTLPWGFTPAELKVPATIWQGSADPEILPGMAQHLAQEMQQATLNLLPGQGHLLLFTHWTAILRALAGAQPAT